MAISFPLSADQRRTSNNRYRTSSLFLEKNSSNVVPFFTIYEEDKTMSGKPILQEGPVDGKEERKYISLKKLYMRYYYDPTEYEFATKIIGDYKHWQAMCSSEPLIPMIEEWRQEAEVKLRSQAIKGMVDIAEEEGAKGLNAAKWLAEGKWKMGKSAGRPSNREKETQNEVDSKLSKEVKNDLVRLGIVK